MKKQTMTIGQKVKEILKIRYVNTFISIAKFETSPVINKRRNGICSDDLVKAAKMVFDDEAYKLPGEARGWVAKYLKQDYIDAFVNGKDVYFVLPKMSHLNGARWLKFSINKWGGIEFTSAFAVPVATTKFEHLNEMRKIMDLINGVGSGQLTTLAPLEEYFNYKKQNIAVDSNTTPYNITGLDIEEISHLHEVLIGHMKQLKTTYKVSNEEYQKSKKLADKINKELMKKL